MEFTVEEIDLLSDRAIDFISYQASVEPDNRRILEIPSRGKRDNSYRLESAEFVKEGLESYEYGMRKVCSGMRHFRNEWLLDIRIPCTQFTRPVNFLTPA
jgi:hypothetical protein